ncbi:hypothetical protein GWK47_047474 [Chionoecetes opilio]|uniref:Reverse transcriptase domain-containing protein n=1 Tax=Chionoecetes opilio TaxID=41210 RepID=A0A8J5CG95_CHIOP|nr:hypothetical protein GWK47_047474 [Chionoecetes opilio]
MLAAYVDLKKAFDSVHHQSDCGASVGNTKITDLVFADDAIICAESLEVLVMALEALHEEAKPLGLEVSWLKTKVQVLAVISRLLFKVTEQAVLDTSKSSSPDEDEEDDFFKSLMSPGPTAKEGTNSTRLTNKIWKELWRKLVVQKKAEGRNCWSRPCFPPFLMPPG